MKSVEKLIALFKLMDPEVTANVSGIVPVTNL